MKKVNEQRCKKGFTLIEMLVVVLIIGILASIALPQYKRAVEKSKASEALIILKSLRDQQAMCYLEKGEDSFECEQGDGENNLFTYANILSGDSDPDCDIVCGPATKDFSYEIDSAYFYAERKPVYTKYTIETTASEMYPYQNMFVCFNASDENYCKMIGFTEQRQDCVGCWFQP